jgi:hypothetical protein
MLEADLVFIQARTSPRSAFKDGYCADFELFFFTPENLQPNHLVGDIKLAMSSMK